MMNFEAFSDGELQAILPQLTDMADITAAAQEMGARLARANAAVQGLQSALGSVPIQQTPTAQPIHYNPVFEQPAVRPQAVVAGPERTIKFAQPPTYSGEAKGLNNFLFKCRQYFTAVGLRDPIVQQQFASSLLEGKALTWWRSCCDRTHDLQESMEFAEFVASIERFFRDVNHDRRLLAQLFAMRMGQKDTIQSYTQRFRHCVIELGPTAPEDSVQLYLYIQGMDQDTQFFMRYPDKPCNMADAEARAEEVFAARGMPQQHFRRQAQRSGYAPMDIDNAEVVTEQESQQRRLPAPRGQGQRYSQQSQQQQIVCHRCGKAGHKRPDCRVNLGDGSTPPGLAKGKTPVPASRQRHAAAQQLPGPPAGQRKN